MNRYQSNDNVSYCLGMSLTIEALKNKVEYIDCIYLSNKANKNSQLDLLIDLCNRNKIKVIYDDYTIEKLSLKENCYCIGVFKKFYSNLKSNKHIVLYGFNDYGELGTILRSAVSFNFKDIVLIDSNIDYFDPRCVRASMGSIFHCNIEKYNSLDEYTKKYHNQLIVPFISNATKELNDLYLNDNYSLVISQNYNQLDNIYEDGYSLKHYNLNEISLSVRSSIILNYAFLKS